MSEKMVKTIIVGVGLFMLILFLWATAIRVVNAGYVGVKTTFGKIHTEALNPGLHFKWPFIDKIVELDTRLVSFEVEAGSASKDLQVVKTVISVQHSQNGAVAPLSYAAVGDLEKFDVSVVSPAVLESLKAVTARYTAEELITKRDVVAQEVSDAIQEFINRTLEEKQITGALDIANVAIKDFNFSHEFNASIETKVKAQQDALRASNEKAKRIIEAEASASEQKLAAEAEAYEIEQVSVARAESIKREAEALAQKPELLQLRAIEQWNGILPVYVGTGEAMPFLSVDQMKSQSVKSGQTKTNNTAEATR